MLFPIEHLNQEIDPHCVPDTDIIIRTNRAKYAFAIIQRARKYVESGNFPEIREEGIARQITAVVTHYVSWRRLAHIRSFGIPTLVVSGAKDNLVGFWNSGCLAKAIGAEWLHFKDGGHGCIEQFKHQVNSAIEDLVFKSDDKLFLHRRPSPPEIHPWVLGSLLVFIASRQNVMRYSPPFLSACVIALILHRRYGGFSNSSF